MGGVVACRTIGCISSRAFKYILQGVAGRISTSPPPECSSRHQVLEEKGSGRPHSGDIQVESLQVRGRVEICLELPHLHVAALRPQLSHQVLEQGGAAAGGPVEQRGVEAVVHATQLLVPCHIDGDVGAPAAGGTGYPARGFSVQLCFMLTAFESTGFRVGIISVEFESAVAIATRLHIALDWYHDRYHYCGLGLTS